ncbi:glutamate racemase [Legionella londiniensis]|uniref:glutamate racemase n=1 Tax=Legionella londiniensis TaxID=45068 RepID=UPI00399CFFA1
MNIANLAVGVFDSGMGGLTVLRALRQALPSESFIYLGDTARLPYGTKSPRTIQQYAVQMARILVERRIKALVIACNTATTAALPHLQVMLPDIPILGVVSPGALAAAAATQNERIAVIATETTIAANAYQTQIKLHRPQAEINARACSVLVALAEEGMTDNGVAEAALSHYLDAFRDEDTLLLGCTHFPVFKPLISKLMSDKVSIVDSAEATASALKTLLAQKNLLNPTAGNAQAHYLVTDSVKRFQAVGEIFLGEPLAKADIELVDTVDIVARISEA